MKNSVKKKLVILGAVSVIIAGNSVLALAAPTVRPMPGSSQTSTVTSSGTSASDETDTGDYRATGTNGASGSSVTREVPTPVPVTDNGQPSIVTDTEKSSGGGKGISVGAMIGWLLVSIIINGALSFWIGNRFYRLSKKDSHITAEIRALRRDVEEKFLQSVGGFAEQETDITNSNEDYSMSEEGITMTRRRRAEEPTSEEEDEMFKKWESRQSQQTLRSGAHRADSRHELNRRRKYQPAREEIEVEEDYDDEENAGENKSAIKSKAKEILGDIFPFKED